MSKIERQMIAEARAAREAQQRRQEAADIGADVPSAPYPFGAPGWNCMCWAVSTVCGCGKTPMPSAPNDEQDSGVPFYESHIIGHILSSSGIDG